MAASANVIVPQQSSSHSDHLVVPQQPSVWSVSEEICRILSDLIVVHTGHEPVDYQHIYEFKQYLDSFPHPNSNVRERNGSTLPVPEETEPLINRLEGWEGLSVQQINDNQLIFNAFAPNDQQTAYDFFFVKKGRAPRVDEFARFLSIFEGNDQMDSSRKPLGKLFLENEELRAELRDTMRRYSKTVELLEEMNRSKDIIVQALGQTRMDNVARIEDLQTDKRNLQLILNKIQDELSKVKMDKHVLETQTEKLLSNLEDERKDKQMFWHECMQLQGEKNALQKQMRDQKNQNQSLRESNCKLEKDSAEKENRIVELEGDMSVFMMENEAQSEYFKELRREITEFRRKVSDFQASLQRILELNFQTCIKSVEEGLELVDSKIKSLKEENKMLQGTVSVLSQKVTTLSENNSQLSQKVTTLSENNSQLSQNNSQLSQKVTTLSENNSQLSQKVTTLSENNSQLSQNNSQLSQKVTTLSENNSQLSQKVTTLSENNSQLSQKVTTLSENNSQLSQKVTTLSENNSQLSQNNSQLSQKVTTLSENNSQLSQKVTTLSENNSQLSQNNSQLSQKVTTLSENNSQLSQNNSQLSQNNSQLSQKVTTLSENNSQLSQKVTTLLDNNSQLLVDLQNLQKENKRQRQHFILLFFGIMLTVICVFFFTNTSSGNNNSQL